MKILVIGGTRFLGRYIVEEAIKQGHEVTLFNRGNNNELFPHLDTLVGDRTKDLSILETGKWDVAIDTCGYTPKAVDELTRILADKVEHYTFISSISVYKNWVPDGIDESYDIQTLTNEEIQQIGFGNPKQINEHYGALKASCELVAERNLPNKTLNVRAGLLVGPHDYTDRFTYWIKRVSRGGKVVVPGRSDRNVQFIDVRDLASWIIKMVDIKASGTFNATGPATPITMEQFLNECIQVTKSNSQLVWMDEKYLLNKGVAPWSELPLWIPETIPLEGQYQPWKGTFTISVEKALNDGLSFRSVKETIIDTLKWCEDGASSVNSGQVLTKEKEAELLKDFI